MASDVSERLRQEVAERAYHVCEYCLVHEDDTFFFTTTASANAKLSPKPGVTPPSKPWRE
jgi:hypothetical protein